MVKKLEPLCLFVLVFLCGLTAAVGQKSPDYKITGLKIVPFDSATGKFHDEIKPRDDRSFFNDLGISLFVTVEIAGQSGSFEVGRKVQITVSEGKKVKTSKTEQIGLIGEGAKFYIPLWLYPAMCDDVKITAKIIGQKTTSTMTRTVPFLCGE
jgi:hypothetical protein